MRLLNTTRIIGIAVLGLAAPALALVLHETVAAQQATSPARPNPVVVELFTSEGCSSCPPADQLLARLESDQPIKEVEIIALEEHVTYWNQGGWFDPFSSESFSIRQYEYAGTLHNRNAYTPQMVVDGQKEFVGSREQQATDAIQRAASAKKIRVTITPQSRVSGDISSFRIAIPSLSGMPVPSTLEIWMAITETGLHSNVSSGENAGEDLHHAAVVRKLRKFADLKSPDTPFSREEQVKLDRGWKRENLRVVVFLQEKKSKRILGAGSAKFPS
jgi:hypothetical protein